MQTLTVSRSSRLTLILLLLLFLAKASPAQEPVAWQTFESFLNARFGKGDPTWKLDTLCPISTDVVAARVLTEYGAMFSASDAVTLPPGCIFEGEADVIKFRKHLTTKSLDVSGVPVTLQTKASDSLQRSIDQAVERGFNITAYDGAIAGSRSYGDTLMLWNGRFFSGLNYWIRRGRLTEADRDAVTRLDLRKRIAMIISWEAQGIFFSTDKSRTIFSSTAPPGASQHLSMIAFDVTEYASPEVREILHSNGWYQTVVGDPVHFTFLDLPEVELPSRGLRVIERGGHRYWVPNMSVKG